MYQYLLLLSLFVLYLFPQSGQCQESPPDKRVHFKINFLSPNIGLEYKINNYFTLNGELGIGLQPRIRWETNDQFSSFTPYILTTPFVKLEPRLYFNFKNRVKKGESIAFLSGDYFSLFATQIIPTKHLPVQWLVGATYGLQRHFAKNGYWGFQTGAYRPIVQYVPKVFWPYLRFDVGFMF